MKIMLFEEESLIRAHWRIEGTGILFKLSSTTSGVRQSGGASHAFDGIASFYVDHRGKIARVVVRRRSGVSRSCLWAPFFFSFPVT